jgi:hypothetical protein
MGREQGVLGQRVQVQQVQRGRVVRALELRRRVVKAPRGPAVAKGGAWRMMMRTMVTTSKVCHGWHMSFNRAGLAS